jgi:hypothetical protein
MICLHSSTTQNAVILLQYRFRNGSYDVLRQEGGSCIWKKNEADDISPHLLLFSDLMISQP